MKIRQLDTIPVSPFVYVKIHTDSGLFGRRLRTDTGDP